MYIGSQFDHLRIGPYSLYLGVHDKGITREIFYEKLGDVTFKSDLQLTNVDNDIVYINKSVQEYSVSYI